LWHMRTGSFLEDLSASGVRPEEVDFVMCTHLHVDHVGWPPTEYGSPCA
jgi:glyoxylase-like metal-dependent hydrolase (beta-lactamase superfamily II)